MGSLGSIFFSKSTNRKIKQDVVTNAAKAAVHTVIAIPSNDIL